MPFKWLWREDAENGGFPIIRGTLSGVVIIRIVVFWGLYWGPLVLGNYQIVRQTTSSHSLWTQQLLRNGVLGKLPGSYSEGGSEVIIVSCKYIRALGITLGIPSQIQRTQLQNESYKGAQKAGPMWRIYLTSNHRCRSPTPVTAVHSDARARHMAKLHIRTCNTADMIRPPKQKAPG